MKLLVTCITSATLCAALCSPAHAIDRCKAKVSKRDGVITVSAANLNGTPLWGNTVFDVTNTFYNEGTCVAAGVARNCQLANPATTAAKTPPDGCTLYLADPGGTCETWIPGCVPGIREAPTPPTPTLSSTVGQGSASCTTGSVCTTYAGCPSGYIVSGGGVSIDTNQFADVRIIESNFDTGYGAWMGSIRNNAGSVTNYTVHSTCARVD